MSMRAHDEWIEPPLAEGLTENQRDVSIGLLTLVGFVLFLVSVWPSFVLGTLYVGTHVADLPFLGQFFGP
jgi:hypothetical protein